MKLMEAPCLALLQRQLLQDDLPMCPAESAAWAQVFGCQTQVLTRASQHTWPNQRLPRGAPIAKWEQLVEPAGFPAAAYINQRHLRTRNPQGQKPPSSNNSKLQPKHLLNQPSTRLWRRFASQVGGPFFARPRTYFMSKAKTLVEKIDEQTEVITEASKPKGNWETSSTRHMLQGRHRSPQKKHAIGKSTAPLELRIPQAQTGRKIKTNDLEKLTPTTGWERTCGYGKDFGKPGARRTGQTQTSRTPGKNPPKNLPPSQDYPDPNPGELEGVQRHRVGGEREEKKEEGKVGRESGKGEGEKRNWKRRSESERREQKERVRGENKRKEQKGRERNKRERRGESEGDRERERAKESERRKKRNWRKQMKKKERKKEEKKKRRRASRKETKTMRGRRKKGRGWGKWRGTKRGKGEKRRRGKKNNGEKTETGTHPKPAPLQKKTKLHARLWVGLRLLVLLRFGFPAALLFSGGLKRGHLKGGHLKMGFRADTRIWHVSSLRSF